MADAVSTQILVDGRRDVVIKLTNVSDGTGESAVVKVDVSALSGAPSGVKIMKVHASTIGMGFRLLWDATTDTEILSFPADFAEDFDFTGFGGIQNNAGTGVTGDIMLTTVGHTAGDSYSVILELRKF